MSNIPLRIVGISAACGVMLLLTYHGVASAQAGSAGGSVGKIDKSVSGSEQSSEPKNSASRRHAQAPPSEKSAASLTGMWNWTAVCFGIHYTGVFRMAQAGGGELTGVFLTDSGDFQGGTISGAVTGSKVDFTRTNATGTIHYTAELDPSQKKMDGSLTRAGITCPFSVTKR